ncbi:hypothetical protein N431DRAFT_370949 [Stipitochalara longipes BDJ]|nr:hypothetical protein N431DRAFT_370949 [Stipitochalara longipes BDJ]
MDPVSITTSTITLIQAAGVVSAALHEFVATFRNADSRVAALSSQLSRLIKFLEAVDRTLRKCRGPLSLASMDEDLWHQSALSLEDCKTTLDELATFINRIKAVAKSSGIFRRARVAMDLTMYAGDITGFEEKIHKSNWAIQTMLSAIQVTLSLRGNETQEKILYELEMLKYSIDQSRQAALHHSDGFSQILEDPSDRRIAYNLKNLTRVAQSFHSSASSTASTIFNGTSLGNLQSDAAMSIRGGLSFTPNKRQQIDPWVKQQRRMTLRRQRKPLQHVPSSAAASVVRPSTPDPGPTASSEESHEIESNMSEMADDNDERDDEAEFQSFLLSGLEEVAKDSMLNLEFAKAQSMLEKAIERRTGSTSEDSDFKQLQIQLAICYFFQHKWHLAEPLIDSIAKSKANFDPVVCNLLHALAIANLVEKRFEKAITVCKQALYGKRRLKRDFPETSETECNETLGLLATIHDVHGNRLDAEALRRKLSSGFSYYHPENELEFIVNHPKLCQEVFGKKITLDWKRPQIPAANLGEVTELLADLPTIKEEDTSKSNKTTKKPLQTFHTKLSLYERINLDSAKEVVPSSPLTPDTHDDAFSLYLNDNIGRSSVRPGMSPKRSFTRRVVQFLGTLRERPVTSRDTWSTRPSPDTENMESPSRPRFGKGFWSKSEDQILKLKKSKTRLRKRVSDDADSSSFPFLRGVRRQRRLLLAQAASSKPPAYEGSGDRDPRPWRYGVDAWLRTNPGHEQNPGNRHVDDSYSSTHSASWPIRGQRSDYFGPAAAAGPFTTWVPASRILEEEEEASCPAELEDNSWKIIPRGASRQQVPSTASTTNDDCYEDRGGNAVKLPSIKTKEINRPPNTTSRRQWLTVAIPKFGGKSGGIPLVAHHPAERPSASTIETKKSTDSSPIPTVTSSSSLTSKSPTKAEIINKVLEDFQDDKTNELAVKERLERDFDEFMRKESQGLWVGESGGRQAWVPASYFKDLSSIPDTVEAPVDAVPEDLREKSLALNQTIPSESSEIDVFSRAFHNSVARGMKEDDKRVENDAERDLPKTRYQLVDEFAAGTVTSPTKLERTQKRPSMPKLMAIDKIQLSEQPSPVLETLVDSGSISPSLPPQQLGRKFSWETVFEEGINSTVSTKIDLQSASSSPPELKVVTRKFSWCSDDSQHVATPDLIRSSSYSSSSSSASSSTSISTGTMLKYDPIEKDLIIVSNDATSSLPETQNLDDFLAQLSASILDKKSKRRSAEALSPFSKLQLRARQDGGPESVDTKARAASPSALQAKLQANETLKALPFIRPIDIYRRRELEHDVKDTSVESASDGMERIINRRHPLREKRKNQKMKREAVVIQLDDEKRMLYPGGCSSLGNSRIGVAF